MNTKLLMIVSAALLAVAGIAFTFAPLETMSLMVSGDYKELSLFFQILGALYFAFAMLNWMARGNIIGGIYSRPIAIANATHFFIGGLALLKSGTQYNASLIWVAGFIYLMLAIFFGIKLFTHPAAKAV